jgi:YgiT-type zinc finger domain-containing protein
MASQPYLHCPLCRIGTFRPKQVSYFNNRGGQLVSVPDFPAWVCDVCRHREYDPTALAELNFLLARKETPQQRRPRPASGPEQPASSVESDHPPPL